MMPYHTEGRETGALRVLTIDASQASDGEEYLGPGVVLLLRAPGAVMHRDNQWVDPITGGSARSRSQSGGSGTPPGWIHPWL